MVVARDIDRIRHMMGNQPPQHLQCDWQRSLLICFGVPAHSPMPVYFIFTGSMSHCIRFRLLANQGCCARVGTGGSWFSGSPFAGILGQPDEECSASYLLFCSDIAAHLIIILWWGSTGRKGRNMWWCSVMCWKWVSVQIDCSCLMAGSGRSDGMRSFWSTLGFPKSQLMQE